MLNVADALAAIAQRAQVLPAEDARLDASALNQVLAEHVTADVDMPPYDKALMDGIAVRVEDLPNGSGILNIVEEITAGQMPQVPIGPGQASRIMTGAPIPQGCDAVIMVERTKTTSNGQVKIDDRAPRPGQHILRKGRELCRGEVIIPFGTILRPQEIGILAAVGRTIAKVHPRPVVAIIATGDELVEAPEIPGPAQIRNSNGPMLQMLVARAGGIPRYLGIGRDKVDDLKPLIEKGLEASLLILCGGVSAGKLDLVPGVLQELGVQPCFHKVAMKPGKPVFFGTRQSALIFGLPGNPVSAFVSFELFVRPAMRRMLGYAEIGPCLQKATLARSFSYQSDRPTYHPAWIQSTDTGKSLHIVPWFGSPDLRGLLRSNALAILPEGAHEFQVGQICDVVAVDELASSSMQDLNMH